MTQPRITSFILRTLLVCGLLGATGLLLETHACAADPEREYFALVVGVGKYPPTKFKNLPGAEPDADELAKTLVSRGFRKQNVTVLTNARGAAEDPLLTPNAENIRREIDLLLDNRTENDMVLIALAGHGLQLRGQPYVFCPFDADADQNKNLISIDELYNRLEKCKAEFKLLLVDACREETLAPAARNSRAGNELESVTRPSMPRPPGGVAAFFSCTQGQVARERTDVGPDGNPLAHGLFFHAVIRGLQGEAADPGGDVTLPDLEKFVKRDVETYSRVKLRVKQYPELLNQTRGLPSLLPKSRVSVARPTIPMPNPIPGTAPLLSIPFTVAQAQEAQAAWAKSLGKKVVETNSLGMEFILIPPGKFRMGSPVGEKGRFKDEDQADVTLTEPIWMGKTEVTQGQWEQVMGATPWKGKNYVKEGLDYAASYVSFNDVQVFVKKLSQRDGVTYRLPTEAEWEWSCRAGTYSRWSFGESEADLGRYAWCEANAEKLKEAHAHRVGLKLPNSFDLHDMHGNVWEWCEGMKADKLFAGTNPNVATGGEHRVLRGGSWCVGSNLSRSANRGGGASDDRDYGTGFRVSRNR